MQIKIRRSLLAFSALSLALVPLSSALQAQPQAQTQTRRARPNSQNALTSRAASFEGVVTRRLDNNEFDLRVGGATFRVRNAFNVSVRQGDRVIVRGTFRSNAAFDAQTVRPVGANNANDDVFDGENPNGNINSVDFPATVTRVISRREIEVRGDNNRIYRVQTAQDSTYLTVGSRLRVRGDASGNRIVNARLLLQGTTGGGYYDGGGNYGTDDSNGSYDGTYDGTGTFGGYNPGTAARSVDFPGRVVRVDAARNQATIRGDNGRDYTVRGAQVDSFRNGDRVRVRGEANGDVIELNRLDLAL